jgi:hypothetical protein
VLWGLVPMVMQMSEVQIPTATNISRRYEIVDVHFTEEGMNPITKIE